MIALMMKKAGASTLRKKDSTDDEEGRRINIEENDSTDGEKGRRITISSKVSVASSVFGNKNFDADVDEKENKPKDSTKDKRGKRRKAAKWTIDSEFDYLAEFDDSPVLQDLLDNFNMDNKMTTKDGDIVRSFVCKFSKKKKGFNCPVKSRTVLSSSDNKMRVYRLEESEYDHSTAETSKRKNFTFGKKVEDKIKELLLLNVSTTNIRKHLLENNFYTTDTLPPDQVFHPKISNIRKKLNIDRKTIGLR